MPILIILLFYINDLVRIKMYYSQTEFVAQQFANIIQNISQKRTDKRIYTSDIRWAFCLANLSMYPGTTMFYKGSGHEFDYSPFFHIYYVKGNADGTASCLWRNRISSYQTSETEPKNLSCSSYKSDHDCSIMRYKTNVTPSQIHPSLKINPGEKKIIIDSLLLFTNTKGGNNTSGKLIPTKQALGLYLASVKYRLNSYLWCFHSVVIFTPKPGLFDDEGPQ